MSYHPNLLDINHSILIVVDMQSKLSAIMPDKDIALMTASGVRLLVAAKMLEVPVLLTEQYPRGLGSTLVKITENLPISSKVFEKTAFSCWAVDGFKQALVASGRRQVILAGLEAHVCILQTALDLLHQGYQVYVVDDAVCSRQSMHKQAALRRMEQLGATIICHESVLFEWLKDSKHADFKAVSFLIKE